MKTKLSLIALLLVIPAISQNKVYADVPYAVYKNDLGMGLTQTLPVRESFKIGGFQLTVNLLKLGYTVYANPEGNILGTLHGNDFDVKVFRVSPSAVPLEQVALQMKSTSSEVVKITPVSSRFGVKGLRVSYGGKPSIFSNNIQEMRYFFVNKAGETICFSGKAKTPDPDWTYFKFIMSERLAPASA
jgi:hypothetical protein